MENLTEGEMYECKKCHLLLTVVGGYSMDGVKLDPKPVWHYCLAEYDARAAIAKAEGR